MRSIVRLSISVLMLSAVPALSCLSGCAVEEPTALPGGDARNNDSQDMGRPKSPDLLTPEDDKLEPPTFDALAKTTNYLSVPVHGLSKPGASVIIQGTANGDISADVASDGRFCADIKLAANRANVLTVFADDNHGKQSASIQITITQSGTPPQQQTSGAPSQNAAIGGSASGDRLYFERDEPSAMIDNTSSTSYGGRNTWGDYSIATVQLASRSKITKVKITAPADCPFTAPFKLYMSNQDAPSNPRVATMSWIEVPIAQSESTTIVNFTNPVIATHFSVVWDKPFNASGPSEVNCGSWALGPFYAIAELEAWTAQGLPPPPASAPSCSGG